MLRRKIEDELLKWKESPIRKVLIVRGARQVGKTSVVRKFGSEHFSEMIEINLENREVWNVFDKAQSTKQFLERVELVFNKRVVEGKTLLFIDEVQSSKNVMELLRFFAEDHPKLHVIVSGSLIEAVMEGKWSVPVGRVEYLQMYPLTFFEYLEASGRDVAKEKLRGWKVGQKVGESNLWQELYREYLQVGGMPEAVVSFVEHHSYGELSQIHGRLMESYLDDIAKYVFREKEVGILRTVISYAPKIAGKVFTYENMGQSGLISRDVSSAVAKVEQARLLYQARAINSTNWPVVTKDKRPKKMIWCDVGLVNSVNKISIPLLSGNYGGQIMEQVTGQALLSSFERERAELYYWGRDKNEGSAEVDFVVQKGQKLVAFEVKAGNGREMKSLFSMIDSGRERIIPVRVSYDDPGVEEYEYMRKKYQIISVPFYLLDRWEELVLA